ncbi:MAG: phosphatase domain-containing protein [Massilia sp.]
MPFMILTREGFDDIVARVEPAGAVFLLNPVIASEAEIARLREAGGTVHVLDPAAPPSLADGALDAAGIGAEPVWVERATAGSRQSALALAAPGAEPEARRAPRALRRIGRSAGAFAGAAWRGLRAAGGPRRLMLLPYLGFGNAGKLWLKGRVLDEPAFRAQTDQDSRWRNMLALYQRLESNQVAGARVRASFGGQTWDAVTDRGGYFSFEIAPAQALEGGWHAVDLTLPDAPDANGAPLHASAQVMVPAPSARFGIISDIDDTVLWSNATNKLNMALMLARSNPYTRQPFKGVAAFYRALKAGVGGEEDNPVFYVSSSPWHLFDPLLEFLRLRDIPVGPLLLRELGVRELLALSNHHHHKLEKIETILRFYPGMQFVLIGDSGEQDPEIYAEVVRRHPQAVRVIYIRNVNPDPSRIDALDRLIEQVSATGTQLILAPDSEFAAAHAAAEKLIQVDWLAAVRRNKKEDERKEDERKEVVRKDDERPAPAT